MADSDAPVAGAFALADELLALPTTSDEPHYVIPGQVLVPDMSDRDRAGVLNAVVDCIAAASTSSSSSSDPLDEMLAGPDGDTSVYDALRSFLLHFHHLSSAPSLQAKLLDALTTGFASALDDTARDEANAVDYRSHRTTLEKWGLLLHWFVHIVEHERARAPGAAAAAAATAGGRKKGARTASNNNNDQFNWPAHLPSFLSLLSRAMRTLQSARIWSTTIDRDAFVSGCILRPVFLLLEHDTYIRAASTTDAAAAGPARQNPIKAGITKVICLAVKHQSQTPAVLALMMQAMQYTEHLSEYLAELTHIVRSDFDQPRLADDFLREVSNKSFGSADTKSSKSFGRFLVRFAELSPTSVRKAMAVLHKHLDSEAYTIRNAMLEVLGLLIKHLVEIGVSAEGGGRANASNSGGTLAVHDPNDVPQSEGDELMLDPEARKKQIDTYWDLILVRYLDVTSYVRSKAVAISGRLLDLPVKFARQRVELMEVVTRALMDKSSMVRKNSISLLSKMILTHPYGLLHGGELNRFEWESRYEKLKVDLDEMERKLTVELSPEEKEVEAQEDDDEDEQEEDEQDGAGPDDDDEEERTPRKHKPAKKPRKSAVDLAALQASQSELTSDEAERLTLLRMTSRYYSDALTFIGQVEKALPLLLQLLASTNKAEVIESMEFFRTAFAFGIEGSMDGMRKMLHLIWVKDNSLVMEDGTRVTGVRSRLLDVYRTIWFDFFPDAPHASNVSRVTKNMIERTYGATLAELTSLEQLLCTMMTEDLVSPDVITKLWEVYESNQAIPRAQRRGAITILSMLAAAQRDVVESKIDSLLRIGLGYGLAPRTRDLVLAKYTVIALCRVGGTVKKVKGAMSDERIRFPADHPMFARLVDAIQMVMPTAETADSEWFSLAEHSIEAIYLLSEQPDALCGQIIKSMTFQLFGSHETLDDQDADQSTADATSTNPSTGVYRSSFTLAQLLFVVGHVALKQIVYLELVEREYKRRKAEAEKKKAQALAAQKGGKDSKKKAAAVAEAEDELDQVAGNAEDDIGDVVQAVKEKELLYGPNSLLGTYAPLLTHVCCNPKTYPNATLRKAAVLSLIKYMCVSERFAEANLGLLLRILTTSSDPIVRSNVVIGLGDIAVCFPQRIDTDSDRLYTGLSDSDIGVKKHTLMVLTHLILNGMIKVKGQLGEMAKCIEDEDRRISDLAKLFFTELATKENAVYNNLPDIISHLSQGVHAVDGTTFEHVMKFIFTFIDKERQAENVVDKLCQRFRLAADERQWRDIAYCLSLLPYRSDRSLKKLIDGLPYYQDKLHNPDVFKAFSEILTKARANIGGAGAGAAAAARRAAAAAGGGNSDLAEFEALLDKYRSKGEEEAELGTAASQKVSRAAKRAPASKASASKRKGTTRRTKQVDSDEETVTASPRRPTRSRSTRATKAAVRYDDDDDEDEEDEHEEEEENDQENIPPPKSSRTRTRSAAVPKTKAAPASRRTARRVVASDDEDDSDI